MANTLLTLHQVEDLFQLQTTKMLGYSVTPVNNVVPNQDKVRIAWPQTGQPAWRIAEDVCFLQCAIQDDLYSRIRDKQFKNPGLTTTTQRTCYTRVHRIRWTLYGPNSFDRAETIKNALFKPIYSDVIKLSNMFLVLNFKQPVRSPELFNGQWWDRTDFEVFYNEKVTLEDTVNVLASAEVILEKG